MIIPKDLLHNSSFLYVQHGTNWEAIGTAFHLSVIEDDLNFTYVVTCKHVIEEAKKRQSKGVYQRLNRSDRSGVDYALLEGDWVYHDAKEVDVAVAPLIPSSPERSRKLFVASYVVPNGVLTRKEESEGKFSIPLGYEVAFIGLFAQFKGKERNYPIVRQGRVALLTEEKIFGAYGESNYYLVECQAYPGNSGSPVYVPVKYPSDPKIAWKIWGMIHGFYPYTQKIQRDVRNQGAMLWSHFGISMVTPIDYVLDVLNKEVFVKQRKEKIHAGKQKNKPEMASLAVSDEPDKESMLTKEDFEDVLKKISRPVKPAKKVLPKKKGT